MKSKALFTALAISLGYATAYAAPVTYTVDGSHTFPKFSYSHFGYSTQLSRFDNTSGTIVFDAEAKSCAGQLARRIKKAGHLRCPAL